MARHSPRSPGDFAVIAVFIVILLTPMVLALDGYAGFDVPFMQYTEHRKPFVAPPVTSGALATGGWERDAEREIADAFPLRRRLIEGYNFARYAWLGDVRSEFVIGGTGGWLFYGAEERAYLTDARASADAGLVRFADEIAARAQFCRRHGIRYLFFIAPNKSTVYAQYLPGSISRVVPSALDRLVPLLRARHVAFVDARPAMIAASRTGEVYSKGDTHWNDAGAYIAYRTIVAALRDAGVCEAIPPQAVHQRTAAAFGDLFGLLGVSDFVSDPTVHYDFSHRAHQIRAPADPRDPVLASFGRIAMVTEDPSLPTAVVFGDSFAGPLAFDLAESFRRTVLMQYSTYVTTFDERFVESEHPTVVVQEMVERSLALRAK